EGDTLRLEQVVTNLLGNAIKYTPHGGRIYISVEHDQDAAILTVRDNGIGVSPDTIAHIFDQFTPQPKTAERFAEGGLGIGLSLVKSLVTMHGGTVVATSPGEGHGSEFVVRLPILIESVIESPRPVKELDPRIIKVSLKRHV